MSQISPANMPQICHVCFAATAEASPEVQRLVKEVVRHKRRFEQVAVGRGVGGEPLPNELGSFWLRKTRKCVLSMLMVKRSGEDEPIFYSGMNIEVSMPTGSLCAERNAMGQQLYPARNGSKDVHDTPCEILVLCGLLLANSMACCIAA
eukprot:COSAG02_NODE_417_length_22746_cov_9.074172_21_plen_149_part_00